MPIVEVDDYHCARWLRNPHVNTILPTLTRKVNGVNYRRSRIDTPDGDYMDLDWSKIGSRKVVVVLHGLEGSSDRHYIRGVVKQYNRAGWDALAINHRGCTGSPPLTSQIYHGGFTEDLRLVINTYGAQYDEVSLVGFSLGGNMVLKYLGEEGHTAINKVTSAVAVSVPVDLVDGAVELKRAQNKIYILRFLRTLKEKVKRAEHLYKDKIDLSKVYAARNFDDFDNHMTGPMLGFTTAQEFYQFASCRPYLLDIQIPTLLVNAADDTFLGRNCYPRDIALSNPNLFLKIPKHGGHVGFKSKWREDFLWSEKTALDFAQRIG